MDLGSNSLKLSRCIGGGKRAACHLPFQCEDRVSAAPAAMLAEGRNSLCGLERRSTVLCRRIFRLSVFAHNLAAQSFSCIRLRRIRP